jgi:acetyl-CoA C-acetyltransferase
MTDEVVICEPLRTPIGRYGGALRDVPAAELGATVLRALLERTKLPPDAVSDVVVGHGFPSSEAPAIGRIIALDGGLPEHVTGMQIDRRCGSGLQAVLVAAMQVQTGASDVVVAGGAESMSNAVHYTTSMRWGASSGDQALHDSLTRGRVTVGGRFHPVAGGMLETAENLRREHGITRVEQDELALMSHRRAVEAQAQGRFDDEIVPVAVPGRRGDVVVQVDENPRPDTTMEALQALRPVLLASDPEATVTAGNASAQNDGAALCVVTSRTRADALGLRPLARLVSWATSGVAPEVMGIAPVAACRDALGRAGLEMADIDLVELNEAFAAQVLACTKSWGFTSADFDRLNVNGSGISLGHPVGATGARILASLLHEMERRDARYGLETMCIGGGQGLAAVFERVT